MPGATRFELRENLPAKTHFRFLDEDADVMERRQVKFEETVEQSLRNMNRLLVTLLITIIAALAVYAVTGGAGG